jgi:hypothetical protein
MRVCCTIITMLFALLNLNCTALGPNLRAKGPATKSSRKTPRLPCEKEPNPRPVCFSCKRAVKISNKLDRLKAWPDKCDKKIEVQKQKDSVKCKGKVAKKEAQNEALREKNKRLTQELGRIGPKATAYVAGGLVGLMVGIAVGVLGAVIIYQFSPRQQGVVFP